MPGEAYRLGRLTRTRDDQSSYWSYCIVWNDDKGRHRRSLDTQDAIAAPAKAKRLWQALQTSVMRLVGDVVPAYLDSLGGLRDEKRKREAWKAASPFWSGLLVDEIDRDTSAAYLLWRGRATNTMRGELSAIRTALHWAVVEKHIEKAPPVVLPAMPESSVEHLTKDQFRTFLEGCSAPHVSLFAMLAVSTGGRKSAILQTKWDQVDFDRRLLDLNPKGRVQNSKQRATVPLNDRIMPVLLEAKAAALTEYVIEVNGRPIKDIKKGVAAAAGRSGVICHPHMFRHSAAVWMAEDRVPMAEIASFLGHRDINITIRVYARYHPDYLRVAAKSLEW